MPIQSSDPLTRFLQADHARELDTDPLPFAVNDHAAIARHCDNVARDMPFLSFVNNVLLARKR